LRDYQEKVEAKRNSALAQFREPIYDEVYASSIKELDAAETE
jgi:hypothetical protein